MNPSTVIIFRILLIIGGFILLYIIGKPMMQTIKYRISEETVEGKVIGFRGRRTSKTIFTENTGKSGTKRKARRPVFRYPVANGSLDSLEAFGTSVILLPWLNFDLNENVQVVFSKSKPENAYIFSLGLLLSDFVLVLLCLFMVKLGLIRRR